MARKTSLSSLAGLPHHFSLRTRVMVFAVWSMIPNLNGPAVVSGRSLQPSLKNFGVGRRGGKSALKIDCQSA